MSAKLLNRVILGLSALGIFIAGVLAWASFTKQVPPCGGTGSGCSAVQFNAEHAYWFGIPVSYFGLAGYLGLFGIALARSGAAGGRWKRLTTVGTALSGLGALLSAYLVYVSLFIIQQTCEWCLASALTMVVLALVHAWMATSDGPEEAAKMDLPIGGGAAAAALVGVLAMSGALKPSGGGPGISEIKGVELSEFLPDEARILGPADAKAFVIEFADFNCPACRLGYGQVKSLLKKYDGRIGFAYRHLPLEIQGHETSVQAAVFTMAAAKEGRYYDLVDAYFSAENDQRVKSSIGLIRIAKEEGFDSSAFAELARNESSDELQQVVDDIAAAQSLGVNSTPTFILFAEGQPAKKMTLPELSSELESGPTAQLLK